MCLDIYIFTLKNFYRSTSTLENALTSLKRMVNELVFKNLVSLGNFDTWQSSVSFRISTTHINWNNQCSIGEHQKQKQKQKIPIPKTIGDKDDSFMNIIFSMILRTKCANCMVHV